MLSRRALLAGAMGLSGTAALGAAVPGVWHRVHDLVDPVPEPSQPTTAGHPGAYVEDEFGSAAMRRHVGYGIAYPGPVVRGLPLLLVLHGKSGDHRSAFQENRLGDYLADVVRGGVPAFAVASVDGGRDTYYHPRKEGTNALRMLVEELLPLLASRGLRVDRFAVGGWSMGGYGSILLAEVLGARRVAALVPDSPALFPTWRHSAPGAFDSAADFDQHDVMRHTSRLATIPTRVTCGTSDPFIGMTRSFLAAVPTAGHELGPGRHDAAWWRHVAPAQLSFAGRQLAGLR